MIKSFIKGSNSTNILLGKKIIFDRRRNYGIEISGFFEIVQFVLVTKPHDLTIEQLCKIQKDISQEKNHEG